MEGELERVLRQHFGPRKRNASGLGSYDTANVNTEGRVPGIIGDVGEGARKDVVRENPMARVLSDIPVKDCPEWLNRYCLEILSRFLEETFRNFQLTARAPSHIDPPFTSTPIDAFPSGVVAITLTTFVDVVSFRVSRSRYRGEVAFAGQSAESAAAFSDLAWRFTRNGIPVNPWQDIRIQLWEMIPPTRLCAPIHLNAGDRIAIQARSISGAAHSVLARICGWEYKVRSEAGNEIKSTLVD